MRQYCFNVSLTTESILRLITRGKKSTGKMITSSSLVWALSLCHKKKDVNRNILWRKKIFPTYQPTKILKIDPLMLWWGNNDKISVFVIVPLAHFTNRDIRTSSDMTWCLPGVTLSSFKYRAALGTIEFFVTKGTSNTLVSGWKTISKSNPASGRNLESESKSFSLFPDGVDEQGPQNWLNGHVTLWWHGHWLTMGFFLLCRWCSGLYSNKLLRVKYSQRVMSS